MPRETNSGAGWIRGFVRVDAPIASGTDAEEYLTDLAPGFKFIVEKVYAVVKVAGTGSGATRLFRVLKGASTVVASKTIVLADMATKGAIIELTLVQAVSAFGDADTLSVDTVATDAVSFTAGTLEFFIKYRTRAQQVG